MANKITAVVTVTTEYEYEDYSFSYYGTTKRIYTMTDAEGTVYVWKTTGFLQYKTGEKNQYGDDVEIVAHKNDRVEITGTVKGQTEYKGQPQTELTRVKVTKIIEQADAEPEETLEDKKRRQLDALGANDLIWESMPYRQYKMHYSDCETVAGSFIKDNHGVSTVDVIIKEGRLKNSGTRGRRFATYIFESEDGEHQASYYAVDSEHAYERCIKENPGIEWEMKMIIR